MFKKTYKTAIEWIGIVCHYLYEWPCSAHIKVAKLNPKIYYKYTEPENDQ